MQTFHGSTYVHLKLSIIFLIIHPVLSLAGGWSDLNASLDWIFLSKNWGTPDSTIFKTAGTYTKYLKDNERNSHHWFGPKICSFICSSTLSSPQSSHREECSLRGTDILMAMDKYPSVFSGQMEAIVYIYIFISTNSLLCTHPRTGFFDPAAIFVSNLEHLF